MSDELNVPYSLKTIPGDHLTPSVRFSLEEGHVITGYWSIKLGDPRKTWVGIVLEHDGQAGQVEPETANELLASALSQILSEINA